MHSVLVRIAAGLVSAEGGQTDMLERAVVAWVVYGVVQ